MSEVTEILSRIEHGETSASSQLLLLVYDELRSLAAARMQQESPGQTLQATALVHEAWLRLVDSSQIQTWNGRGHFFAAAAEAMRRILVERARQKASHRGGGRQNRLELIDLEETDETPVIDLMALDEALRKLQSLDPRKAELIKLRFFAGLTIQDAADILGISTTTADNDWAYAKCWLRLEMAGENCEC
jgi:RNA polymerase sigma factor (TIGR02999 family)